MKQFIIETYQEIYSKIYRVDFDFIPSKMQEKVIDNFLILINKQGSVIGEEFLWDFIVFQFERFSGFEIRSTNRIQLNWILGKKALSNWKMRQENWAYWNKEFLNKYDIRRKKEITYKLSKEYFERERRRLYGSDEGFLYCMELELYDRSSVSCLGCKFKKDCYDISPH